MTQKWTEQGFVIEHLKPHLQKNQILIASIPIFTKKLAVGKENILLLFYRFQELAAVRIMYTSENVYFLALIQHFSRKINHCLEVHCSQKNSSGT